LPIWQVLAKFSKFAFVGVIICLFSLVDSSKMAYTKEQYEALKSSIAQGTHSVTYGDKTVTYRSLDEMKGIVWLMKAKLFPDKKPTRRCFASFDRGFHKG
jgi:hypothetical protein